jgi:hypothetical protein
MILQERYSIVLDGPVKQWHDNGRLRRERTYRAGTPAVPPATAANFESAP